ncbi:MAG: condensation domain-containing protein, partial [Acidobacteria bacterium]|nr:condensation domain-containing protein [Acidobacteriota bacterium]
MIIKKFEEIVQRFPTRAAIKAKNKALTYAELNFNANRVAHAITGKDKEAGLGNNNKTQQAALLFDCGIDMIVGLLGALKANKTYVPLDSTHPGKRLLSILEYAEVYLILTDNRNFSLACELCAHAGTKISVLNINAIGETVPGTNIDREASAEKAAYILYTSGSTGKPKGILQIHRNVLYYARNWIERNHMNESDRVSLFTDFTHDGAIPDIYSALLSGACLYPYAMKENGSAAELCMLLAAEKITIWHSTPTLFRYFTGVLEDYDYFPNVRRVLLGGESLRAHDLELYKVYFPNAHLVNVYGQTESTVSSLCIIGPHDTFNDVCLGDPLDETKIFLVDEDGGVKEEIGGGEIVVACDYTAPGYWKDKENTEKVFLGNESGGRFYRTGDMGRFTLQGAIKIMGRKDFQIKIRGFRIELGEIETALLRHYAVVETVVIARPDENNDLYLCAYIVSNQAISSGDLREFLVSELPDYMMPRYFLFLEKMPLTSSGKIDRQQLPEPGNVFDSSDVYVAPANEVEEKLTDIWQEVLKIEKIGVTDNFTELGGHSLLIMSIISKIHRAFNVELELTDVFDHPTIKELAQLIMKSKQTIFAAIEPAEKKEYYPLSSSQKRLYILQQMNPGSLAYHMPEIIPLPADSDWGKIAGVFNKLINRHESLRTSFHIINDTPVQRIHQQVEFDIAHYDLSSGCLDDTGERDNSHLQPSFIIHHFIQAFDLSHAPLLRVGLIKKNDGSSILLVDIHHIISDGVSNAILIKDYQALHNGDEMPPLRLQYKDYAEWQDSEREKETRERQEKYWLKQFAGELPAVDLPHDYPRPVVQSFAGNAIHFKMDAGKTRALRNLAAHENVTLYILMMAVNYVLLAKICGWEDIVMGTDVVGRRHIDLENIIGVFVNTLALRNYPRGEQFFKQFLLEVKKCTLEALEHQEYPFEDLVDRLAINRDASRNPLFDVMFSFWDSQKSMEKIPGAGSPGSGRETYHFGHRTAKFDLSLSIIEAAEHMDLSFEYGTKLFKETTIKKFISYFIKIVDQILENPGIKIWDIVIVND